MITTTEPIDDDLVRKTLMIYEGEMQRAGQLVLDAMNEELASGTDQLLVISSALYAVGAAIAQMGVVIATDDPLRLALPPFVAGYLNAQPLKQ